MAAWAPPVAVGGWVARRAVGGGGLVMEVGNSRYRPKSLAFVCWAWRCGRPRVRGAGGGGSWELVALCGASNRTNHQNGMRHVRALRTWPLNRHGG
jgi:hypothetical protein